MLPFEVTVLGCSSATPTSSRNPSAQALNVHERFFLIDCGEATQIQIRRFRIKIQRIDHIFISHLHGDHYLGLPGLLGTMHLLGRDKELHIYSPPGLKEIIDTNHYHSKTFLRYNLEFHILEGKSSARIFEDDKLTVETIPMNHRIPCYGFLFREKTKPRNIIAEKIEEQTHHCTAKQAGIIASKANVGQLIIGHYSARYKDLSVLLKEAKEIFENTVLAIEGQTYKVE